MSSDYDQLMGVAEQALFDQPKKTGEQLRNMLRSLAGIVAERLEDADIERMAREIEFKDGIKAGLGAVLDSEDFEMN